MSGISINGLSGSGIDTESLISKLMELERVPLQNYETRKTKYQTQKDTWTEVNTKLLSLKTKTEALLDNSLWESAKVSVSDSSKISATSIAGAAPGVYNFSVLSLGTYVTTKSQNDIAASSINTAETIWNNKANFNYAGGLLETDTGSFKIEVEDPDGKTVSTTIDWDADYDSINNIINKINRSGIGITAFYDETLSGDGKLVFTSNNAGTYKVKITDTAATGPNLMGPSGVGGGIFQIDTGVWIDTDANGVAATNAVAKLNNVDISPRGNKYTINGTNVTFLSTTGATDAAVTVSRDYDNIVTAISDFVTQYNTVQDYLKNVSKFQTTSSDDSSAGILSGNYMISSIKSKTASLVLTSYDWGASTSVYELASQIGITMGAYGTDDQDHIVLDTDKLRSALDDNSQYVENFFGYNKTGSDPSSGVKNAGMAYDLKEYLNPVTKYQGLIYSEKNSLDTLMDELQDRIDRENDRLTTKENQLRTQFSAMESSLALLNSQSSYFQTQIDNLTKSS